MSIYKRVTTRVMKSLGHSKFVRYHSHYHVKQSKDQHKKYEMNLVENCIVQRITNLKFCYVVRMQNSWQDKL